MVDEVGDPSFDRVITGPAGGDTSTEGTDDNPFELGLFQNLTDVQWPTGEFVAVGFKDDSESGANPVCVAGWSAEGRNWFANTGFSPFNGRGGLFCAVRGFAESGERTILAGGFKKVPVSGDSVIDQAAAAVSFDDAKSWEEVELPGLPPPDFESETNVSGLGLVVAYDPAAKTFFIQALIENLAANVFTAYVFAGSPGSMSLFTSYSITIGDTFPPLPWTTKSMRVVDVTGINVSVGDKRTYQTSPQKYKFAAANPNNQQMTIHKGSSKQTTIELSPGDSGSRLLINGGSASVPNTGSSGVRNATIGKDIIAAVTETGGGAFVYISDSGGSGWEQVLDELAGTHINGSFLNVSFS